MPQTQAAHSRFRTWLYAGAALGTALVGILDYNVPFEINLLMLYLVPVLLVAWYGSRQASLLISMLAAITTWGVNLHTQPWSLPVYAWKGWNDVLCLVLIALGCTAARARQDIMASRVNDLERTRGLEEAIVRISEREQIRIGQDLHDGICQELAAVNFAMQCLCWEIKGLSAPAEKAAAGLQEQLAAVTRDARDLAHGIFPVQMTPEGFLAAFSELVATTDRLRGLPVQFVASGDVLVGDPQAAMHLYRIAQEALSNALKHSQASEIEIRMEQSAQTLTMQIIDDGIGVPSPEDAPTGIGLQTMAYRARSLGASLALEPRPGGGTIVKCIYPLPPQAAHGVPASEEMAPAAARPAAAITPFA